MSNHSPTPRESNGEISGSKVKTLTVFEGGVDDDVDGEVRTKQKQTETKQLSCSRPDL